MRARCTNPANQAFPHYGGRGITICDRWLQFENFLADMGQRPSAKHSIDRIDVNGNYEPGNCRWSTPKEQANNKRNNRIVTYGGIQYTASQLSDMAGFKPSSLIKRLNNWQSTDVAVDAAISPRHCGNCGSVGHNRSNCKATRCLPEANLQATKSRAMELLAKYRDGTALFSERRAKQLSYIVLGLCRNGCMRDLSEGERCAVCAEENRVRARAYCRRRSGRVGQAEATDCPLEQPHQRHKCGRCHKVGHNARTCTADTVSA